MAWIPLRQRPGFATLANALLVGVFVDLTLAVVDDARGLGLRVALLVLGVLLDGLATALYIGAWLGAGPRDGLMTGLVRRTGRAVRVVRTLLELGVLAVGFLLGGTVGIGTVVYALAIGPVAHALLPLLTVDTGAVSRRTVTPAVDPHGSPDVA